MVQFEPRQLAAEARDAQPLAADPRPGTRPLADTVLGALGIELITCDAQAVVVRVEIDENASRNAFGMLLVAGESAASTAANLCCGSDKRAFGAELDAANLRPAAPGAVIVVATNVAATDERQVWRITAFDALGDQVFEGRCTLGVVPTPR